MASTAEQTRPADTTMSSCVTAVRNARHLGCKGDVHRASVLLGTAQQLLARLNQAEGQVPVATYNTSLEDAKVCTLKAGSASQCRNLCT